MPTYSHSKLSCFEQCKQKYKFAYIDKITVLGQSIEAFMGNIVHEALEKLYKDVKHGKMPSLKDVLTVYKTNWDAKYSADEINIVNKDYTAENFFELGTRFLASYYEHHKPFDKGMILGLETQDFLDLGNSYKFHVRIDRLMFEGDGVYSVNDYKTANTLPKQEKLDNDRQLAIYSLWVHERFAEAVKVKLIWHYLAFDRHMESQRTLDELYKLKQEIIERIKEIEATKLFNPTMSALCSWCEYKNICPAWGHELKIEGLPKRDFLKEEGVKLVNELKDLADKKKLVDEEIEIIKNDLVAYSKQYNLTHIQGSDVRAVIKEDYAFKLPAKGTDERTKLEATLKKLGLYDELLTLDACSVKKLDEETLKKLKINREKTTQVRLSKKV